MAAYKMLSDEELAKDREYVDRRVGELKKEYSSFEAHYKELSEFVEPRRGRFFVEDRNIGDKRHKAILNSRATLALRRATAGLLAGIMSPSRPWFAFDMFDRDIMQEEQSKIWLDRLKRILLRIYASSNLYNMAAPLFKELLLFGTGCMTHVDDFEDVARFYTHSVGSYMLAPDDRGNINTLARVFQMTTFQLVKKFGIENVSRAVREAYDKSEYGAWHTVCHLIEPNPYQDTEGAKVTSEALPFRSVYWEKGAGEDKKSSAFLSRKGYSAFPAYCPRWEVTGEDIYGTNCPGMLTLGDVKQLQKEELEKAKAIEKSATPPLQGPPTLRKSVSNLPGGMTINGNGDSKIEPIYNVTPRIDEMLNDIKTTENRIDEGFFNDLFMAITSMEGVQPKNQLQLTHVHDERLLQIGPVLEQIHGEWLAKMVSRTIQQVIEAGLMPPAPPKLQGKELDIEFVSALAMAQRAAATGAIERTVLFASSLTEGGWDTRSKIDADYALDEYSSLVGAPPQLIQPTPEAQSVRAQEAKQAQSEEALQQAQQIANVAKMASDAKLKDDNILSRAVENGGIGDAQQ